MYLAPDAVGKGLGKKTVRRPGGPAPASGRPHRLRAGDPAQSPQRGAPRGHGLHPAGGVSRCRLQGRGVEGRGLVPQGPGPTAQGRTGALSLHPPRPPGAAGDGAGQAQQGKVNKWPRAVFDGARLFLLPETFRISLCRSPVLWYDNMRNYRKERSSCHALHRS